MFISEVAYELYKQNWIDTHTTPKLRLQVINDYYDYIQEAMDKSDYECLQDYVDNHMYEIESELIELAKKWCEYDEPINIESTAKEIYDRLQYCEFNDITDSSGYFFIKQFEDGIDRAVDVYKFTEEG